MGHRRCVFFVFRLLHLLKRTLSDVGETREPKSRERSWSLRPVHSQQSLISRGPTKSSILTPTIIGLHSVEFVSFVRRQNEPRRRVLLLNNLTFISFWIFFLPAIENGFECGVCFWLKSVDYFIDLYKNKSIAKSNKVL